MLSHKKKAFRRHPCVASDGCYTCSSPGFMPRGASAMILEFGPLMTPISAAARRHTELTQWLVTPTHVSGGIGRV